VIEIGYLAAFLGGVLTLISPCSALLLPSFFAYAFDRPAALLGRTTIFYGGLAATLVPLGIGASFATRLFFEHRTTIVAVAGWALIGFGSLTLLGGGAAFRAAQRAQGRLAGRTTSGAVFGLGAVYGFAGFCSGPILGAVLTVAAADGRPLRGGALLAVYALGMAGPLFLLALGWDRFDLGSRRWLRGRAFQLGRLRLHSTSVVSGLLIVAIGVFFLRTDGTASGVPGLPSSVDAEQAAQLWLRQVADVVPDLVLLAAVGLGATGLLLWRLLRDRASAAPSVTSAAGPAEGVPDEGVTDPCPPAEVANRRVGDPER
jgi:cytochrome c biogenesis protein CcdA